MPTEKIYPVPANFAHRAYVNAEQYRALYQRSVADPAAFWAEQAAEFVTWYRRWDRVEEWDYSTAKIRWFEGARLNVAYNCLDRHLDARANQIAILWEGDDPKESRHLTYRDLYDSVCRCANALKARGVKRGDRVAIYMPMIPETAIA
ncbi:MAG: acetyl-coenzyme A synthetase N-terminal domain-containing protein, partial [Geminicoccales bacterium]